MAIFGDGLSVRVSAQTRDFTDGMRDSQSALGRFGAAATSVLAPLQALGSTADDAEGEVDALGRSALTTSGALGTLGGASSAATGGLTSLTLGSEGAAFSMRSLSGTVLLSLVPALGVLAATLAPIVAALGGFVAVGGAIAGVGIVGTVAAIAEHTETLRGVLDIIVAQLRNVFGPAIEAARDVLIELMLEFNRIIPQLAPTGDELRRLAGAFADLGTVLIESLPAFVDLAVTLTSEFLPPFNMWLQDILPQLPGMIMGLVSAMDRMIPRFLEAGRLLAEMTPPLLEFGFTALNVIGPALADLATILTTTLQRFNELGAGTQNLITQGVLLAPVLLTLISLLGGISAPVLAVVAAVGLLWRAWQTNFGNIRGVVQQTWQQLQSVLGENFPTLVENVKTILDTILPVLEPIFNFLLTVAGTVLVQMFDSLISVLTAITEILTGDFAGAWTTISGLIDRTIGRLIELINTLTGGRFGQAVSAIEGVVGAVDVQLPSGPAIQPGATATGAGGPTNVNVNVTGDTGVIEDVAAETTQGEFQSRESRNRRLANR